LYGKLFAQMYDGTLATKGPWESLVTFQQLIILADKNGVVDMTPEAISRRTTIPLKIIENGIKHLEKDDKDSRSPAEDGRRIVLLSDNRDWGWRIVNYGHYRKIRSEEERREYHRQYMRKRRSVNSDVKESTDGEQSQPIAVSSKQKHKNIPPPSGAFLRFWGVWPSSSRKGSRGECWERWRKHDFDLVAEEIISHVEGMKSSADWLKNGGEFIPAPLAYLNKKRWEGAETAAPSGEVI
jgi:hypothetical protein